MEELKIKTKNGISSTVHQKDEAVSVFSLEGEELTIDQMIGDGENQTVKLDKDTLLLVIFELEEANKEKE